MGLVLAASTARDGRHDVEGAAVATGTLTLSTATLALSPLLCSLLMMVGGGGSPASVRTATRLLTLATSSHSATSSTAALILHSLGRLSLFGFLLGLDRPGVTVLRILEVLGEGLQHTEQGEGGQTRVLPEVLNDTPVLKSEV